MSAPILSYILHIVVIDILCGGTLGLVSSYPKRVLSDLGYLSGEGDAMVVHFVVIRFSIQ